MSKIEEMALEYGKENPFTWYSNGYLCEDKDYPAFAFKAGANAVLNEILRYIGNHSSFESDILKDKLKELKGEEL